MRLARNTYFGGSLEVFFIITLIVASSVVTAAASVMLSRAEQFIKNALTLPDIEDFFKLVFLGLFFLVTFLVTFLIFIFLNLLLSAPENALNLSALIRHHDVVSGLQSRDERGSLKYRVRLRSSSDCAHFLSGKRLNKWGSLERGFDGWCGELSELGG